MKKSKIEVFEELRKSKIEEVEDIWSQSFGDSTRVYNLRRVSGAADMGMPFVKVFVA
jgi:hypothetical protein